MLKAMKSVVLCILLNENYCLKAGDYQGKRVNPPHNYPVLPRILLVRCVDVFVEDVSFRFKAKENLQRCGGIFFEVLISSKGASVLGMF